MPDSPYIKVTLLRDWKGRKQGDTIPVLSWDAESLVSKGWAQLWYPKQTREDAHLAFMANISDEDLVAEAHRRGAERLQDAHQRSGPKSKTLSDATVFELFAELEARDKLPTPKDFETDALFAELDTRGLSLDPETDFPAVADIRNKTADWDRTRVVLRQFGIAAKSREELANEWQEWLLLRIEETPDDPAAGPDEPPTE